MGTVVARSNPRRNAPASSAARKGTREFKQVGPTEFTWQGETTVLPEFFVCTGEVACRRRRWRGMPLDVRARIISERYE